MQRVFDESAFCVRSQAPLRLGHDSDPEPDVAVVGGTVRDYLKAGHPQKALLVIEVADTTLSYDRGAKASLYASARIADYWIINLKQRQCEIRRKPVKDAAQRFGFRYSQVTILKAGDEIAPLAAKDNPITIASLLP
jgi:Uma2 family endonuclease